MAQPLSAGGGENQGRQNRTVSEGRPSGDIAPLGQLHGAGYGGPHGYGADAQLVAQVAGLDDGAQVGHPAVGPEGPDCLVFRPFALHPVQLRAAGAGYGAAPAAPLAHHGPYSAPRQGTGAIVHDGGQQDQLFPRWANAGDAAARTRQGGCALRDGGAPQLPGILQRGLPVRYARNDRLGRGPLHHEDVEAGGLQLNPQCPPELASKMVPVKGDRVDTEKRPLAGAGVPVRGPVANTSGLSGERGSEIAAEWSHR